MSDDDDDLSKFTSDPDDHIKPIDVGGDQPPENLPPNPAPPLPGDQDANPPLPPNPAPDLPPAPGPDDALFTSDIGSRKIDDDLPPPPPADADTPPANPIADEAPQDAAAPPAEQNPHNPFAQDANKEEEKEAGSFQPGNPFAAKLAEQERVRKEEEALQVGDGEADDGVREDLKAQVQNERRNIISVGGYVDLIEKDPTLKKISIGAGWDQKSMETDMIDIDLSLFLLDKEEMTRMDEDFIFYNNPKACDGAIQHQGDNRTGAGEGDDENISIDLNGIPFDVLKIMISLSIYDEEIKGYNFSMVKNMFVRIINREDNGEICRFEIDNDAMVGGNGMYAAVLIREGPRWVFEATGKFVNGGLAAIAKEYGLIIRELQSTGIRALDQGEKEDDGKGEQPQVRLSSDNPDA